MSEELKNALKECNEYLSLGINNRLARAVAVLVGYVEGINDNDIRQNKSEFLNKLHGDGLPIT